MEGFETFSDEEKQHSHMLFFLFNTDIWLNNNTWLTFCRVFINWWFLFNNLNCNKTISTFCFTVYWLYSVSRYYLSYTFFLCSFSNSVQNLTMSYTLIHILRNVHLLSWWSEFNYLFCEWSCTRIVVAVILTNRWSSALETPPGQSLKRYPVSWEKSIIPTLTLVGVITVWLKLYTDLCLTNQSYSAQRARFHHKVLHSPANMVV